MKARNGESVALDSWLTAAVGDESLAARMVTIVSPRARRVTLRLDPTEGRVILTRPKGVSTKAAAGFVAQNRHWIAAHLNTLPPRVTFCDGAVLPYRGEDHILRHVAGARRGVWREDNVIFVSGQPEHMARRVTDWLKTEAKTILTPMARVMAATVDCKVARVSVRDTKSRWGSCSADGKLSFSWRLMLAPADILIYVAAHEVAHLRHLDHSRAFWRTVAEVLAAYAREAPSETTGNLLNVRESSSALTRPRLAREWLRRHGPALHAYG